MTGIIIELFTRNQTEELEERLEKDVEDFAIRGLLWLLLARNGTAMIMRLSVRD